jgi:predicted small integral membrane protein
MFEWMAWTTPVAVFFCCIVLMLLGMTVWELKSPTVLGVAFFRWRRHVEIVVYRLLSAAYVNLAFVGQRQAGGFARFGASLRSGSVLWCQWGCWC